MHIRNILLLLICIISLGMGQTAIKNAQVLFYNDQLDELEELLPDLERDYPNHPVVMFFKGVFEQDALNALVSFEKVHKQFPDSQFADESLFRMGQYYYSTGDYSTARQVFQQFIRQYPQSGIIDRVQYLFCQSYYGEGKLDSSYMFLQAFVKNAQSSPFVNMAVMDLENEDLWKELEKNTKPAQPKPKPVPQTKEVYHYSIQIGAFSVQENAVKVKEKFQPDHYVEIREKQVRDRTFYAVWVGRFQDRESAMQYAHKHIDQYKIEYKIVKR